MKIRVAIAGPRGKMGTEAIHTIMNHPTFELVAALDYKDVGEKLSDYDMFPVEFEIPVFQQLDELIETVKPDVFLDLTTPQTVFEHTKEAILKGVRPVIGSTGLSECQLEELKKLSLDTKVGVIIAPNFAIGAVLMMKFAQLASRYFPEVEIIESHHNEKLDAPSGTAIKTAQLITQNRPPHKQGHPDEEEILQGSRGGSYDGIPIHSVRLPGLVAHQKVLFGGDGQLLTIQHDSLNRTSFMSGIVFSIEQVMKLESLVYGLENIMK